MLGQEEVGRRIKLARDEADLTQPQLADRIGLATAQSISRYERGEVEVPMKRLRRIADATGKPMSFFMQEPGVDGSGSLELDVAIIERLEAAVGVLAEEAARLAQIADRLDRRDEPPGETGQS